MHLNYCTIPKDKLISTATIKPKFHGTVGITEILNTGHIFYQGFYLTIIEW